MKGKFFAVLLAACMLLPVLTACGSGQEPDVPPVSENGQTQQQQQQDAEQQQDDGFAASVSGRVEDPEGLLTEEQKQLMIRLLNDWYTDIALFDEPQLDSLFADEKDAAMHEASIRTLTAIRQQALTDLRMKDVDYVLTVTKAEPHEDADAFEQLHEVAMPESGIPLACAVETGKAIEPAHRRCISPQQLDLLLDERRVGDVVEGKNVLTVVARRDQRFATLLRQQALVEPLLELKRAPRRLKLCHQPFP